MRTGAYTLTCIKVLFGCRLESVFLLVDIPNCSYEPSPEWVSLTATPAVIIYHELVSLHYLSRELPCELSLS